MPLMGIAFLVAGRTPAELRDQGFPFVLILSKTHGLMRRTG
jgi:hypothetical protein